MSSNDSTQSAEAVERASYMRISWRTLAILVAMIAAALLVTTLIVAEKTNADALATTALALAVIAFAAQLIVYVAQVVDSSDLRRQAGDVNAATQRALARIGSTVDRSDRLLREQNDKILDTLLANVRAAEHRKKEEDDSLTVPDIVGLINASRSAAEGAIDDDVSDDDDFEWEEDVPDPFEAWPDPEDAEMVHGLLSKLDPVAIGQLVRFAQDYRLSLSLNTGPGLPYFGPDADGSPFSTQLVRAGLLQPTGRYPKGRPPKDRFRPEYYTLTDLGMKAARLVLAPGVAPGYVVALLGVDDGMADQPGAGDEAPGAPRS